MLNGDLTIEASGMIDSAPPPDLVSYEYTLGGEAIAASTAHSTNVSDLKQSNLDDFDADIDALASQLQSFDWKEDVTNTARKMLQSSTVQENLEGVMRFKKMLCIARQHVFKVADDVIRAGVIPRLVAFVANSNLYDLQLAAAFCLTNVAAGDDAQTDTVVESNAIPVLMELLDGEGQQLRRQAIFCLANIAGSTAENRRRLLAEPEYCRRVMSSAEMCRDPKIEGIAAWNLRNMCVLPGFSLERSEFAVRYFLEFLCDSRVPLTTWSRECSDIQRYACEALIVVCSTAEGRAHVLELNGAITDACLKSAACELLNPSVRLLHLDILFEISRGDYRDKETVFTYGGEYILSNILRGRSCPYKLRLRAIEVLNHLADSESAPSQAARLLSSGCQLQRAFLPSIGTTSDNAVVATPIFASVSPHCTAITADGADAFSPVDVALDICFQRGGVEDPVMRETSGVFICRVVRRAPLECLATHGRVEEVLGLVLEVLEFQAVQESRSVAQGMSCGMDSDGQPSDGDVPGKASRGTESPSHHIIDALFAMEQLMDVGNRVGQSRGLCANPVVAMLEQLGVAGRLRDLLRQTQSLAVSEKAVSMLSRNFSFPSIPQ